MPKDSARDECKAFAPEFSCRAQRGPRPAAVVIRHPTDEDEPLNRRRVLGAGFFELHADVRIEARVFVGICRALQLAEYERADITDEGRDLFVTQA